MLSHCSQHTFSVTRYQKNLTNQIGEKLITPRYKKIVRSLDDYFRSGIRGLHICERNRIKRRCKKKYLSQGRIIEFLISRKAASYSLKALLKSYPASVVLPESSRTWKFVVPLYDKIYIRSRQKGQKKGTLVSLSNRCNLSLSHDGVFGSCLSWICHKEFQENKRPCFFRNRIIAFSRFQEKASLVPELSCGVDVLQVSRIAPFALNSALFERFLQKYIPCEMHSRIRDCQLLMKRLHTKSIESTGRFDLIRVLRGNKRLSEMLVSMALCFSLGECLAKAFQSRVKISPDDFSMNTKACKMMIETLRHDHTCFDTQWRSISLKGDSYEALRYFGWSKCSFTSFLISQKNLRFCESPLLCCVVRCR